MSTQSQTKPVNVVREESANFEERVRTYTCFEPKILKATPASRQKERPTEDTATAFKNNTSFDYR